MIQSAEEFVSLRDSQVKEEYDRASNDEASIMVWRDVINKYPEHRKWVAHNKTVPLEILRELCQYDAEIRRSVAVKRKLSIDLFELLAKDDDPVVRQGIASNKKAPISVIVDLMQDGDLAVASVAKYNFYNR